MKIEYKFVTGEKVCITLKKSDTCTEDKTPTSDVTKVSDREYVVKIESNLENEILEIKHSQGLVNRKETRRHESLDFFDKNPDNKDKTANIYGQVLKRLSKDKLYSAIAKLKPKEQELLHNLCLKQNPITQAAYGKILGITENAVQLRLAKVKKKLKEMLQNL